MRRRDGRYYSEARYASCPRLKHEDEECDGMVPLMVRGETDDINQWNGGTPGWEEVEAGACPSCGFDAWDGEQVHDLSVRSQKTEEYDD